MPVISYTNGKDYTWCISPSDRIVQVGAYLHCNYYIYEGTVFYYAIVNDRLLYYSKDVSMGQVIGFVKRAIRRG